MTTFQSTPSSPPPYYDHDPEQGEDHDHDQENKSILDDTNRDDNATYLRRNNIWAHRSTLELMFGVLFFSSILFFLVCFCVITAVITRSAIKSARN